MLVARRFARPLTLACATAALAVAPGTALARPVIDPPWSTSSANPPTETATVVREVRTGGDTTLALIVSGGALVIAAAGAGLAGTDHRRIRHLS